MNQEIIFSGRESIKHFFKRSIITSNLSHTYILSGAQGIGKNLMVDYFAKMLLCESDAQKTPCGLCAQCRLFDAKNHPDFHCIEKKQGEASIKIDQIRALETVLQKHAYQSARIVCVIRDAGAMTEQAQNALLKTLEEPPSNVIILLTVKNISAILSTILSRCQVITVPTMPQANIQQMLTEQGVEKQKAILAARLSQGMPNKAIEVVSSQGYNQTRDALFEIVSKLHTKSMSGAMDDVEYFLNNKQSIDCILAIMESWYRDIMIWHQCRCEEMLFNCDWVAAISSVSKKITANKAMKIIEAITKSRKRIKQSTNFQLVIEELLLTIVEGE